MNRDETKRAADHCAQDNTPKACQECEVRLKPDCATYFARAYLALREQVETVALPALKPFSDEADRRPFLGQDACQANMASPIGGSLITNLDLVAARAAIKAIEEAQS